MMTVAALLDDARSGQLGLPPEELRVPYAFSTLQRSRHPGWTSSYANYVAHLRAGRSVGSCFFEPGEVSQSDIEGCVGETLAALLDHPLLPTRIAALDTYLAELSPHEANAQAGAATAVTLPPGTTIEKMHARTDAVLDLLDPRPGQTVAMIGIVNTLVHGLRQRSVSYLLCDYNAQPNEWGDPVTTRMDEALERADLILATGMTLANGSFDRLLDHARRTGTPLTMFAQTGSFIVPRFLGHGVSAVSSEPYPFLWVTGGPSTIYHYRAGIPAEARAVSMHPPGSATVPAGRRERAS
jgi:hypothetical protein